MKCICNNCKYLWQQSGKWYCIKNASGGKNKYSKTKKQCDDFIEGTNIKNWLGKSNGWWKKQN